MPAFNSQAFIRWRLQWMWWRTSNCSLLLIYGPREDKKLSWPGWLMAYPHKWSPISYRSSAERRKNAGQRLTFYRWATRTNQLSHPRHNHSSFSEFWLRMSFTTSDTLNLQSFQTVSNFSSKNNFVTFLMLIVELIMLLTNSWTADVGSRASYRTNSSNISSATLWNFHWLNTQVSKYRKNSNTIRTLVWKFTVIHGKIIKRSIFLQFKVGNF